MNFVKPAFRKEAIDAHTLSSFLIFLFPYKLRKKHLIYLSVTKSRCTSTVFSLLNPKYSLATVLVTRDFYSNFLFQVVRGGFVFFLHKISTFLKHSSILLRQKLTSISQSLTILLKILFHMET